MWGYAITLRLRSPPEATPVAEDSDPRHALSAEFVLHRRRTDAATALTVAINSGFEGAVDALRTDSMADVTNVASSTGQAIGRYFSLVSVLPSTLFVTYLFLLIESGAWQHEPKWGVAIREVSKLDPGGWAGLVLISVATGLALHPVQFTLVQLFEGYWGTGPVAQRIRSAAIRWHHKRRMTLYKTAVWARDELTRWEESSEPDQQEHMPRKLSLLSMRDEADRAGAEYPKDPHHIMPTRLGNMLRRYEVLAGAPYRLDAPTVLPHLSLVAPNQHVSYLNDQRSAMDLSVRMALMSLMACWATMLFLWNDGLWLLIALIPYGLTYILYRGAIVCARSYGIALSTIVSLNRFSLYSQLHLEMPADTEAERAGNEKLMELLQEYDDEEILNYEQPDATRATVIGIDPNQLQAILRKMR